jgi:hypothetical protein
MGPAMRAAAARLGIAVAQGISPTTDVWALGLLAYELCTGLPAAQFWGAETTAEIPVKAVLFAHEAASSRAGDRAPLLPPGFDAWFARAVHTDAAQRWPSVEVAVAELLHLFVDLPAAAPGPDSIARASALPISYGPGGTEIAGWAGGTPPPPPSAAALPPSAVPTAHARAKSFRLLFVASLVTAVGVAGAGAAVVLGPRFAPAARDVCRSSGERCDEACEGGDAWSCTRVAARLERGDGVPRDEARAAALYEKACDAADPLACANLGRLHRLGRGGLPKDLARARLLFEKACNVDRDAGASDGARGCALLGEAYRDGAGGVSRDDRRALGLFQDACGRGDPTGCKDLGGMHQYGRGGLARDEAEAAALYRRACDGGEVLGCNDLGVLVGAGRGGLARDERLAADLYRRACDGDEMLGCDNLA